jgi:hypothetical protein
MRFAAGPPRQWTIKLRDGTTVEVWADGFQRDGDDYTFSSLFDLDAAEEVPKDALVMGATPSNPRRFLLAVARIPKAAVLLPHGDEEWPAISG